MGKCKPHPDIEEAEDVNRYCINHVFPMITNKDGTVQQILVVTGVDVDRSMILGVSATADADDDVRSENVLITFDQFLDMDKGPFKSHMVEWEDTLVYFMNTDPGGRGHGYSSDRSYYKCFFPPLQQRLDNMSQIAKAFAALSYKRTRFAEGIRKLQDGECVGIALSDRFGIITTDSEELPQLVYKTSIIGEVRDEQPILLPQFEYLTSIINGLCNK